MTYQEQVIQLIHMMTSDSPEEFIILRKQPTGKFMAHYNLHSSSAQAALQSLGSVIVALMDMQEKQQEQELEELEDQEFNDEQGQIE